MSSKSKQRRRPLNTSEIMRSALTMYLWAYCQVHEPSVEEMERMSQEIQSVQSSVLEGRLKLSEIRQALEDEHGWKVIA